MGDLKTTCQLMWTLQVLSPLCMQLAALILRFLRFIVILMCDLIVFRRDVIKTMSPKTKTAMTINVTRAHQEMRYPNVT